MSEPVYKLQPAGHEEPPAKRKYPEPDRKLRDAFEKYLSLTPERLDSNIDYHYSGTLDYFDRHAKNYLEDIKATPEEAHGLLLARELKGREKEIAGFFLSAVYNKSEAKDIVYDLETEVWHLAYSLSPDKAFINYGNGYHLSGTSSKGIIINYIGGKKFTTIGAGFFAKGPIITYGGLADPSYYDGDDELIQTGWSLHVSIDDNVNISGPWGLSICDKYVSFEKNFPSQSRHHFSRNEISELSEYVHNLAERFKKGTANYRIVLETLRSLGPKPHEKIKQDIVDILKRAGRDV